MPRRRAEPRTRPEPAVPPGSAGPRLPEAAWAALVALAVLVPFVRSLGAPLGVPAADDFDFLRHALAGASWLDGGGGHFYWRPLARQAYFGLAGPLMLGAPFAIAVLHAALLALAGVLVFRTLLRGLPAPAAAAAASFALLSEPVRMLIAWPSSMQDLGSILFAVLAVHESSRGRTWTALAALAAGLLCKEQAIVAAPFVVLVTPRRRLPVAIAAVALVAAWGLAYRGVVVHAGLALGRDEVADPALRAVAWPDRVLWALGRMLRDAWAPTALPSALRPWAWGGAALLGVAAIVVVNGSSAARARLRALRVPLVLGLAWWVAAAIPLAEVHPGWWPYRGVFAAVGLGVACTALAWAAHPALAVALVVVRVATVLACPGPPPGIVFASALGGEFDFPKLVQLQRLASETRRTLRAAEPTLPHGANVGLHHLPRGSTYAYAGDKALQVWYADTTLHWITYDALSRAPDTPVATIVEYQPHVEPHLARVAPAAMRALLASSEAQRVNDCATAMPALARAESLQTDSAARVFLATVAAKRSLCLFDAGDAAGAEYEAARGLDLWPDNPDSRYILARLRMAEGHLDEAERLLVTHLAAYPEDSGAQAALEAVRKALGPR